MHFPAFVGKLQFRIIALVVLALTIGIQAALFRPATALTTTPTTMNFQGRLTNSSGNIMADGLYNMKFRLYDASTGGTLKWNETRETTNRVQVTNGLFSVQLGQVTPMDPSVFASGSLYFEIELPTPGTATCSTASCGTFTEGPMTPRNKLSTSAYAYNSETLDGIDSAQFARNDQGNTFLGAQVIQADSATAFQVQNAAGTSTFLNVDTLGNVASFKAGNDAASLGSELFAGFGTGSGWTIGGSGASSTATHTSGTTALNASPTITPTAGTAYQIQITIASRTTGSVNVNLGSIGAKTYSSNGTFTWHGVALSTNNLSFTPTTDFNGIISAVSVKPYTNFASPIQLLSTAGTATFEVRAGGTENTFVGLESGRLRTTGNYNTSLGAYSLRNNTTGSDNVAVGSDSLLSNTSGSGNNAMGNLSLNSNTTGNNNVSIGEWGMYSNTTGSQNVSVGALSGYTAGSAGTNNTFLGYYSGGYDSVSDFSTASNLQNATAIGAFSQVQANNSIVLGSVDLNTKVGVGTTIPGSLFSVSPSVYSTGTAYQSGTTVTGVGTSWGTGSGTVKVGMQIIFSSGESATITAVNSNTSLTVGTSQTVSSNPGVDYRIHAGGFQVTNVGEAFVKTTSTTAFRVQNASGTTTPLVVDTSSGNVAMSGEVVVSGASTNTFDVDTGTIILNATAAGSGMISLINSGITTSMNPTSLVVQDPSTSVDLLTANASTDQIQIGSATTNATAVTLVLDSYSTAADPTGTNGGMYYNTATHTFRCYRDSKWENCGINPIDRGFVVQDEFFGGAASGVGTNNIFGELGWRIGSSSTGTMGPNSGMTASASHPGYLGYTTPATANAANSFSLGGGSVNHSMIIMAGTTMKTTVGVSSATAMVMRAGLHTGKDSAPAPVSGVWWEADTSGANTTWYYCYGNGTTATCTNSNVTIAATTWTRMEIRVTATGTNTSAATFIIDTGGGAQTFSVNSVTIDTTNTVSPSYVFYGSTTTTKSMYIDYFQLFALTSSQR